MSQAGMIGTVAIETGPFFNSRFTPRKELYNDPPGAYAYFENMYGPVRANGTTNYTALAMGNTVVGDGARYPGRGFIQITWKNHYLTYGDRIQVDLVNNPDQAMEPVNAARIAALYWQDRDIQTPCNQQNWARVRSLVQGGSAGLDHLIQVARDLIAIAHAKNLLQ